MNNQQTYKAIARAYAYKVSQVEITWAPYVQKPTLETSMDSTISLPEENTKQKFTAHHFFLTELGLPPSPPRIS